MKQALRDLSDAVMTKNRCLRAFNLIFTCIIGALGFSLLHLVFGVSIKTLENPWVFFPNILLITLVFMYVGYHVYKKFVGPLLIQRGWNENSLLEALLLEMILLVLFAVIPSLLYVAWCKLF